MREAAKVKLNLSKKPMFRQLNEIEEHEDSDEANDSHLDKDVNQIMDGESVSQSNESK